MEVVDKVLVDATLNSRFPQLIQPLTPIALQLQVETTSRHLVYIVVDNGDGSRTVNYSLVDEGMDLDSYQSVQPANEISCTNHCSSAYQFTALFRSPREGFRVVSAVYMEPCMYHLALPAVVYEEEGVYQVSVQVFDDETEHRLMSSQVEVMQQILLVDLRGETVTQPGVEFNVTAHFISVSKRFTSLWSLVDVASNITINQVSE